MSAVLGHPKARLGLMRLADVTDQPPFVRRVDEVLEEEQEVEVESKRRGPPSAPQPRLMPRRRSSPDAEEELVEPRSQARRVLPPAPAPGPPRRGWARGGSWDPPDPTPPPAGRRRVAFLGGSGVVEVQPESCPYRPSRPEAEEATPASRVDECV